MTEQRARKSLRFLIWVWCVGLMVEAVPLGASEPSRLLEAEVVSVKGQATLTRGPSRIPVKDGQDLKPGDLLVTGGGAELVMAYENGHVLKLQQLTSLKLSEASFANGTQTTKVKLDKGSLYLDLEKLNKPQDSFQVNTNNTMAGVRGTSFEVDETDETEVAVLEGEVEVGEGDQMERLGPGFFNKFRKGKKLFAKRRFDNRRLVLLRGHRDHLRKSRELFRERRAKRKLKIKKIQKDKPNKPWKKNGQEKIKKMRRR